MRWDQRVVGLDPTSHGFGYVVFEGPERLIDWGHAQVQPISNARSMERIARLLTRYMPDAVVIEDTDHRSSRRRYRVRMLLKSVARFSEKSGAKIERISPEEVRKHFAEVGAQTKHQVAQHIASTYVELAPHLPPPRKIWMSEDERMSIFDAAAFVLTAFEKG
ncbi:hypothetical protein MJD09_06400 [bacterium]|nr:hypothetical protein [bacterium]